MKKLLLLMALLLAPVSALADAWPVFTGLSAGGTIGPQPLGYVETGGYKMCAAQISTADAGVATIAIEGSSKAAGPYDNLATILLNGTSNYYYVGPCPAYLRLNAIDVSSGTVNASVEYRKSGQTPDSWQPIGNFWQQYNGGVAVAAGSVSSVGVSAPAEFTISGSPVTTSGTIALSWASQLANKVLASPDNASGIFSARSVVPRDLGATAATGLCLKGTSATVMDWASCGGGGGMADPGGNGIMARTALNTSINRTIVCADTYCTWANGDGVSGNPSFTLSGTVGHDGGFIVKQAAYPGTVQTSANINIDGVHTSTQNGIAVTFAPGMSLENNTASITTTVTEQVSPSLYFTGHAWNSSTPGDEKNVFRLTNRSTTAAGATTGSLFRLDGSNNGGAFTSNLWSVSLAGNMTNSGTFVAGSNITSTAGSIIAGNTNSHSWTSRSALQSPVDGTVRLTNNVLTVGTGLFDTGELDVETVNGARVQFGSSSESLTLAAAATTDTTGNLLPANSYIVGVVVRVTTVIPTATTFQVGDATTAGRFCGTGLTFGPVAVAATTTGVCNSHLDPANANAAGPNQVAAAKIRITPSSTPGTATGVVRITVFWKTFVPPTS